MANSIDIVVPDLGDFDNVEVIEVLVSAGDTVAREDGLITLETDKASFDVPSPDDGVIESLTAKNGDTVSEGDVIGRMTVATGSDSPAAAAPATEPTSEEVAPPKEAAVAPAAAPAPGKPPVPPSSAQHRPHAIVCADHAGRPGSRVSPKRMPVRQFESWRGNWVSTSSTSGAAAPNSASCTMMSRRS